MGKLNHEMEINGCSFVNRHFLELNILELEYFRMLNILELELGSKLWKIVNLSIIKECNR